MSSSVVPQKLRRGMMTKKQEEEEEEEEEGLGPPRLMEPPRVVRRIS